MTNISNLFSLSFAKIVYLFRLKANLPLIYEAEAYHHISFV